MYTLVNLIWSLGFKHNLCTNYIYISIFTLKISLSFRLINLPIYLTDSIPIIARPEVNFWHTPTQKIALTPIFPIISTNYSLQEENTLI